MKTIVLVLCLAMMSGCAAADRQAESEEAIHKLQRETDQRLHALEQSVSSLDSQVAQLNNRVYEVRTSRGKKTGMTAVPVMPAQTSSNTVSPASGAQNVALTPQGPAHVPPAKTQSGTAVPHGRVIDPTAQPYTPPSTPQKARPQAHNQGTPQSSAGMPATPAPKTAGAATSAPSALGLPPESATVTPPPISTSKPDVAVPAGSSGNAVPVPAVSSSDMALPPEKANLGLPPLNAEPQQAKNVQRDSPVSATATPSPAPAPQQPATPQRRSSKSEDAAYKEAVRPALSGRAGESISRFQTFLQEYPNGRYAANAEYWIGEGYYAQGNYKEALAQFEKVNAQYPRHHKNADALLKTGMTLSKMGDKAGASDAYKKLITQFPHSEAAQRARSHGLVR